MSAAPNIKCIICICSLETFQYSTPAGKGLNGASKTFYWPPLSRWEAGGELVCTTFKTPYCIQSHCFLRSNISVDISSCNPLRKNYKNCLYSISSYIKTIRLVKVECCRASVIWSDMAFRYNDDARITVSATVSRDVIAVDRRGVLIDLKVQISLKMSQDSSFYTIAPIKIILGYNRYIFEAVIVFRDWQKNTLFASFCCFMDLIINSLKTVKTVTFRQSCLVIDEMNKELPDRQKKKIPFILEGSDMDIDHCLDIFTVDLRNLNDLNWMLFNKENPRPPQVFQRHRSPNIVPIEPAPQPAPASVQQYYHHRLAAHIDLLVDVFSSTLKGHNLGQVLWQVIKHIPDSELLKGGTLVNQWHTLSNLLPASQLLFPPERPIVYLNLSVKETLLGRVEIRLWGHMRRAQHFLALCLGTFGPSYKGSRFNSLQKNMKNDEFLIGGHGTSGQGLMEGLEWGGKHIKPAREGMITGCSNQKPELHAFFALCSSSNYTSNISGPFGEVIGGMSVVKKASRCQPVTSVIITDCGLVVPPTE
ncbi:unnamed protein product, partial [Meganyctiphanes norvegica]